MNDYKNDSNYSKLNNKSNKRKEMKRKKYLKNKLLNNNIKNYNNNMRLLKILILTPKCHSRKNNRKSLIILLILRTSIYYLNSDLYISAHILLY